jgi:signal transduction histidine kinase/response regulator RpfG family c-di-GMP phosphodiesterase
MTQPAVATELVHASARELSRELLLGCDAAGELIFADDRAFRRIGARPGVTLASLCAPGVEAKATELVSRACAGRVDDWELAFVVDGKPVTVSFAGQSLQGGGALLLGTLVAEHFVRALDQVNVAMGEVVTLNRQVTQGKRELERRNQELERTNRELADSNRGVRTLHDELVDKTDELTRQAEIKARVVANVSHEFRTPLHAILGLTQILADGVDGPLGDEQQKQVQFIRSSAEELLQLVNDVLDLTKVEAGKAALKADAFQLSDWIASMRGMLRPLAPQGAQVQLVFDDLAADVQLDTDRGTLSQIVRNLVSNALKFTRTGEVRVSARRVDDAQVAIAVSDTGIGIAPADQERIFEEFTQVDGPQQDVHKGTGLGLPLARRLTEILGGRLELESAPGRGSTFTLTFPRAHPEVAEMQQVEERGRAAVPGATSILVVEDDRKTIFIYEKYLTLAGFHVIAVRSIDEARGVLAKLRPAAIVLDIVLENETSWDFLADVKRHPETSDIPVLVCTVTNREQKARALGADEFWLKPINQERLLRRLRQLSSTTTPRVLVIDDDEKARYLMRHHLQNQPYELIEAATGPEGVALARSSPPHVIFLDFLLQDVTAFDVLDELKADPRTRSIPVIIVTSHVLDAVDRSRLLREAEAVISKESLSRELAINRIRDALRKAGRSSTSA